MMEPTDNALHAGCLGNINATWTFHGALGPLRAAVVRRQRDPRAPPPGSPRSPRTSPSRTTSTGSTLLRGRVGHRRSRAGSRATSIPDRRRGHVNYRYAPGRTPGGGRGAPAPSCAAAHGELRIDSQRAVGRRSPAGNPLVDALIAAGDLARRAQAGLDAGGRVRARRPRRRSTSAPATRRRRTRATSRSRSRRWCAATACSRRFAARRMRLSPVLDRPAHLPVRAPHRGEAPAASTRGVAVIDFGVGRAARGHAGVHPRGARGGARAAVDLPARRGAARAAGGGRRRGSRAASARRWTPTPRSCRPSAPRRRSSTSRRCVGGDLVAVTDARLPGLRARRACSPASRWSSCRCTRSAASCPTSTPSTRRRGSARRSCG